MATVEPPRPEKARRGLRGFFRSISGRDTKKTKQGAPTAAATPTLVLAPAPAPAPAEPAMMAAAAVLATPASVPTPAAPLENGLNELEVGSRVEVFSQSAQAWKLGRVISVDEDAVAVKYQARPSPFLY